MDNITLIAPIRPITAGPNEVVCGLQNYSTYLIHCAYPRNVQLESCQAELGES